MARIPPHEWPEEDELFQTEAAPHLFHFGRVACERPQRGIVGLVGVVAAQLIVVVHLDARLRQEGFKGLEIFVAEAGPAVEQQHLGGAGPKFLGPDFVLAAGHRQHADAGNANAGGIEPIDTRGRGVGRLRCVG